LKLIFLGREQVLSLGGRGLKGAPAHLTVLGFFSRHARTKKACKFVRSRLGLSDIDNRNPRASKGIQKTERELLLDRGVLKVPTFLQLLSMRIFSSQLAPLPYNNTHHFVAKETSRFPKPGRVPIPR
jgi:hypothetical protein